MEVYSYTVSQLVDSFFISTKRNYEYGIILRDHNPPNNDEGLHTLRVKRGDVVVIRRNCGRYLECSRGDECPSILNSNIVLVDLKFCVSLQNTVSDHENEKLATSIGEIFVVLETEVASDPLLIRCINRNLEEGGIPKNIVRMRIDRCMFIRSVSPTRGEKIGGQPILKGTKNEIVVIVEEVGDEFLKCINKDGKYGLVARKNVQMALKLQREKNIDLRRNIIRSRYPHLIKLPFRLVLSRIFPFVPCGIYREFLKEGNVLNFFGYFSLDPQRTPFFLFPNLCIGGECDYVIDYTRLKSLNFRNSTPVQMRRLNSASPQMTRLEALVLNCYVDDGDEEKAFAKTKYSELFSSPSCFPNLKRLTISQHCNVTNFEVDLDLSKWESQHNDVWENLIIFSISGPNLKGYGNALVRILNRMVNLETLHIDCLERSKDFAPNTVLNNLKSLKKLRLTGLMESTTKIECYDTLESAIFFECDPELIRRIVLGSTCGMKEVDVSKCRLNEEQSYDWLVKEHRVSKYEKIHMTNLVFQTSSFESFGKNVELMYLSRCPGLKPHHLSSSIYPHLKSLTMYHLSSFDNVHVSFPSSRFVEHLTLDIPQLNESFYVTNEWSSLKNFVLFDMKSRFTGKNWKPMENVRIIRFMRMKKLMNSVFENRNIFPNLERLSLDRTINVTGKNWDPSMMKSLRYLEIVFCMGFDGSVFLEDNVFPFLEHLILRSFKFKKKGGFRGMKGLKKLEILTSNVTDVFFERSTCFDNLEFLVLEDCEDVNGTNWVYFKSLLGFKARKGVFLSLDFLKSPPFGDHVEFVMEEMYGDDFFGSIDEK